MDHSPPKIEFDDNTYYYPCFLNDFPCELDIDGKTYDSVSHYFYAKMFEDSDNDLMENIRLCQSAEGAKELADSNRNKTRPNWYVERLNVLYKAIKAKFEKPEYKKVLMNTNNKFLLYTSNDSFFGAGVDNNGRNILGKILMEVRMELK